MKSPFFWRALGFGLQIWSDYHCVDIRCKNKKRSITSSTTHIVWLPRAYDQLRDNFELGRSCENYVVLGNFVALTIMQCIVIKNKQFLVARGFMNCMIGNLKGLLSYELYTLIDCWKYYVTYCSGLNFIRTNHQFKFDYHHVTLNFINF